MSTRTADQHLTVEELANRLQVSKKTIYKWNYFGTGPRFIKAGRACRYPLRNVIAWEAKNTA